MGLWIVTEQSQNTVDEELVLGPWLGVFTVFSQVTSLGPSEILFTELSEDQSIRRRGFLYIAQLLNLAYKRKV